MIVRVPGVKRVRAKGRLYHYHRASGVRLKAEPGSPAFFLEIERLNRSPPMIASRPAAGTIGALMASYRGAPEFMRLADRTRADYQKVFDWLAPIDKLPLLQIDGAVVLDIRDRAFAQRKRRFANYVVQVLGIIFGWGVPQRLAPGNPAAGIAKIARPRDLPRANRPWTDAECRTVFDASASGLKTAIGLAMFAGMRLGDAARVTWSIYDGANLEWRQGKTGDLIWLPVAIELKALLDALPRTAPNIVIGARGLPLSEGGIEKAFRTLVLRLKRDGRIDDGLTFHGLRHTAGKTLADLGADPRMIQALLGHRSMSASLHYSEGADRRRAAAAAVHVLEQHRNEGMENRRTVFQNRRRSDA